MGQGRPGNEGQGRPDWLVSYLEKTADDVLWHFDEQNSNTGGSQTLSELDRACLWSVFDFEQFIPRLGPDPALAHADQACWALRMHDALVRYHVALPFDEAERTWLTNLFGTLGEDLDHHACADAVASLSVRILSAGIWRAVSGADLLSRWPQWRREIGPYAGHRVVAEAVVALNGVRELLEECNSPE